MKPLFICALAALVFVSCSSKMLKFTNDERSKFPENTIIDYGRAQEMNREYFESEELDISRVTFNKLHFLAIIKEFKDLKRWSFVRARYNKDDQEQYRKRNDPDGACDNCHEVAGFATFLLEFINKKDRVAYFDITEICPPPRGPGCEGADIDIKK